MFKEKDRVIYNDVDGKDFDCAIIKSDGSEYTILVLNGDKRWAYNRPIVRVQGMYLKRNIKYYREEKLNELGI